MKPPEHHSKIPPKPVKAPVKPDDAPLRAATLMDDRRRHLRAMLRMPVLLHVNGKPESLKAMTVAVSEVGAMLVVADSLPEGTRLVVENPRSHKRLGATVTRVPQKTAEGFMLPVEFAERASSFWDVVFPAPGV